MDGEAGGEEVAVCSDGHLVEAGRKVSEGEVNGGGVIGNVEAFVDKLASCVEEFDSDGHGDGLG